MWPVNPSDGEFAILDQAIPLDLVHRRLWLCAFANPQGTGMPCFKLRAQVEQENGSRLEVFDWTVDYKATVPLGTSPDFNNEFTGIQPPYAVTNETGNPDRSTSPHAGAGDARVLQFRYQEGGGPISVIRATMWPVDITARLRRVVWSVRKFTIDGGTGGDLTGNIFTAFVMQSQAFPFS